MDITIKSFVSSVLNHTYTLSDFNRRIDNFEKYYQTMYFQSQRQSLDDIQATILHNIRNTNDHVVIKEGITFLNQVHSREQTRSLLDQLKNEVENIPVVTLYLGKTLSNDSLQKLSVWIRAQIHPFALFKIIIDPATYLAGCAIAYNGIISTYTFQERFWANKDTLIELIQHKQN